MVIGDLTTADLQPPAACRW